MKSPLSYQASEYDCGPTTMLNSISYLFHRREIPPDVIKHIMLYCLDSYNIKGEFGKSGTSGIAMMFLSNWLNQFGRVKKFPICCEFLTREDVQITQNSKIVSSLQQGGAVVVKLVLGGWHYVLLTGAESNSISLFDPYYRKKDFGIKGIVMVSDKPSKMNRLVDFGILNSPEKGIYSLGPVETREAVVLFNKNTRKTPENSIEYFI